MLYTIEKRVKLNGVREPKKSLEPDAQEARKNEIYRLDAYILIFSFPELSHNKSVPRL